MRDHHGSRGAARNMSSSRSEFLKGLRARLQSDIALREAERDEELARMSSSVSTSPGSSTSTRGRQFADDPIEIAAAARAARLEPRREAGAGAAGRSRASRVTAAGLSPENEEDLDAYPPPRGRRPVCLCGCATRSLRSVASRMSCIRVRRLAKTPCPRRHSKVVGATMPSPRPVNRHPIRLGTKVRQVRCSSSGRGRSDTIRSN